jgi:hypothetical protein
MTLARREKTLIGLLVVIAIGFGASRLGGLLGSDDELGGGGAARRRGAAAEGPDRVATLEVARLEATARDHEPGRDPFRYYQPPPPPPPPGPTAEELAAEAARRRGALEALQEQTPPEPSGPELPEVEVSYLGSFGPTHRKIAVFTDGDEIYNALVGDVLEDQFIVSRIGFESVDLTYVDFPDLPPVRLAAGN